MKDSVSSNADKAKNRAERVEAELPISVNGMEGTTKNISATGIYFELDAKHQPGSQIEFWVEINSPSGPMKLNFQGEVVRVDELSGKLGIAAKIISNN